VAVADLQGDGITDLVVSNSYDNTVSVLLGNGNGTFQPAVNYSMSDNTTVANDPRSVTLGSLRTSGPLDIVMTNFGTSNVTVLLGNGNGTFGAPRHLSAGMNTSDAVAIADFDGDGTPDLLVNTEQADVVTLLPGNGAGRFGAPVQFATGSVPFAMSVGQFDGHNLPEVAVLNNSTISVMLNDSGVPGGRGAAFADDAGQILGTGVTSSGTRQAFLLTPDKGGVSPADDPGGLVSGVETPSVLDAVGAPPAFQTTNATRERAREETATRRLGDGPSGQAIDAVFAGSHGSEVSIDWRDWVIEEPADWWPMTIAVP
jgi:hypothetical protein